MININAYGGNWLHVHILLKMTGSFGCVVTSKQCPGGTFSNQVGKIICPTEWNRVNASARIKWRQIPCALSPYSPRALLRFSEEIPSSLAITVPATMAFLCYLFKKSI